MLTCRRLLLLVLVQPAATHLVWHGGVLRRHAALPPVRAAMDIAIPKAVVAEQVVDKLCDLSVEDNYCGYAVSTGELVRFCIPLLAMGMATPALSLVDTAVVGRQSALGLASLAPATALCDLLTYVFYALGATTTNFVASALCRRNGLAEERRVVRTGLFIANAFGIALAILLLFGGAPLLRLLGASQQLLGGACAYTSVRALGLPAALSLFVLQAASLGAKKWKPPLLACTIACVFNLFADMVLVCGLRLGVVGAALGTIAAQYSAVITLMVLRARHSKQLNAEVDAGGLDANENEVAGMARDADAAGAIPIDSVGDARTVTMARRKDIMRSLLPSRAEFSAWARFGVPLGLGQVARVANVALVTAAATSGGAIASAAHQVCVSLFWAVAPFGDAISLIAQAFLPSLASSESSTLALVRCQAEPNLDRTLADVVPRAPKRAALRITLEPSSYSSPSCRVCGSSPPPNHCP